MGIVLLFMISALVLVPLVEIIKDSLSIQSYDLAYLPDAEEGQFSWFHYERVFIGPLSKALFLKPLVNSLLIGVCVTAIAILFGTVFAWLMVRTNIPLKKIFGALIVVPYMMP